MRFQTFEDKPIVTTPPNAFLNFLAQANSYGASKEETQNGFSLFSEYVKYYQN